MSIVMHGRLILSNIKNIDMSLNTNRMRIAERFLQTLSLITPRFPTSIGWRVVLEIETLAGLERMK